MAFPARSPASTAGKCPLPAEGPTGQGFCSKRGWRTRQHLLWGESALFWCVLVYAATEPHFLIYKRGVVEMSVPRFSWLGAGKGEVDAYIFTSRKSLHERGVHSTLNRCWWPGRKSLLCWGARPSAFLWMLTWEQGLPGAARKPADPAPACTAGSRR